MILPASLPSHRRGEPLSLTPRSTRTRSPESMNSRLEVPSPVTISLVRGLPVSLWICRTVALGFWVVPRLART